MSDSIEANSGIKTGRVSDRVAAKILKRIASGELSPGTRLSGERQIAEEMEVSRVSVRAALQSLKAQGYLEAVQGGGTKVISSAVDMDGPLSGLLKTNAENFHDLSEIRADLEVWAARRAAINATEEDIADIERAVIAMAKARGKEKALENINFHFAVARASGSAVYMHLFDVIRDVLRGTDEYYSYRPVSEYLEDSVLNHQHEAVCTAIKNRDPEAAARAMSHHLSCVLERLDAERKRRETLAKATETVAETETL
ncbi:MAG: FadR family transcriptional regulator [Alphaproteobacteria bacterium]|nr:FadR family transcriptional regulator [Rhodospirillales bacterium]MCW9045637.1 FadR family transcriptional regulator [Alphaproteobacteria bacterium]